MNKIEKYFNTKAVSNSLLGALWNPRWIKLQRDNPDLETEEKSYFRIGSALDCLLTSPERWGDDFLVVDANKPYGLMGRFVDNLPADLKIDSEYINYIGAYDKSGYKMSLDKVVGKFWENEEAVKYYRFTRNAGARTVLSRDEFDIVTRCKELILANEWAREYFITDDPYIELMHQVPIYFTYQDVECKALLDGIHINHKDKIITPFDLKTTGKGVYDFNQSFTQFGYYRQAALYELAIQTESSPVFEYLQNGYTINDFRFIVVENKTSSSTPAVIYKTTKNDRLVGIHGGTINGKVYKGINQLLEDYKFHTETDRWDLPLDLIKSNGEIELNVFDAKSI